VECHNCHWWSVSLDRCLMNLGPAYCGWSISMGRCLMGAESDCEQYIDKKDIKPDEEEEDE